MNNIKLCEIKSHAELKKVLDDNPVFIWGAGLAGKRLYEFIDGNKVRAFVDNSKKGKCENVDIISPEMLLQEISSNDCILVANRYVEQIQRWGEKNNIKVIFNCMPFIQEHLVDPDKDAGKKMREESFDLWKKAKLDQASFLSIQSGAIDYCYRGVPMRKDPFDIGIMMQLIWDLKPGAIVEFGAYRGGSALWMADMTENYGLETVIHSVDLLSVKNIEHPRIQFHLCDANNVSSVFSEKFWDSLPRPILVIEDTDHKASTTLNILNYVNKYLEKGDFIVVEDGILSQFDNSPHLEGGPRQAVCDFLKNNPKRYQIEKKYCDLYGPNMTWNPDGYLSCVVNLIR